MTEEFRMLFQRRLAFPIFLLAMTASCADRPQPVSDYCQKLGRRLSEKERVSKVLLFAYSNADHRHLNHLDKFRNRLLRLQPSITPTTVVAKYLQQYPDCCAAVPPWPIRRYDEPTDLFGRNSAAEEVFKDYTRDFRWTHDVLISGNGRLNQSNPISYTEFAQSDCGVVARGSSHG